MRKDTMQVLESFKIKTFGNQKNIEKAEEKIRQDEIVRYIAPTNVTIFQNNTKKKETLPGVFILTDKRVVFTYKIGLSESSKVFGLEEVRSIDCNGNGLSGGHVEIHTMTETLNILVNYKSESINMLRDTIEKTVSNFKQSGSLPVGQTASNADEIVKYKQLLDMGVITQAEFEAKKKQLLGL